MLPKKLAFVDIETTGARAPYDRIIEIGVLRVEDNKLVKTFNTLLNPDCYLSPFIENLTGIAAKDLEGAPTFYSIKDELTEILKDCIFVAHNVRFDYSFIRNEYKRLGSAFSSKHFCTVKLSRRLFPEFPRHNLDAIIERFNLSCENRHRAFDDAKILWEFYQKLQKNIAPEALDDALAHALKKPSFPMGVSEEAIDKLPESPGVYLFYGKEKTPLYIGKSINIRERVLSHFSSDHLSTTEMSIRDQLEHIEAIPTSGELAALFRESTLIKQMQPLYNRKLRLTRKLIVVRETENADGYTTVEIDDAPSVAVSDLEKIIGIFRSRKQAKDFLLKFAKDHGLCQKILGLESTRSGCFGYHLGWCKGACRNREKTLSYNLRFLTAVSRYKLKTWPFKGPILIEQKDELNALEEYFMVDKWCLLGSFSASSQDNDLHKNSENYTFDLDTYKILVNYIFNPRNQPRIQTLGARKPQQINDYLL